MLYRKGSQNGFTLIEVMVTLSILAIAAAFVVPSINRYFVNLRLKSSARTLFADMNYAKVSALKTLRPHTVLLGGTTGTRQGWVVFADSNDNGVFDTGEKELRSVDLQDGITFQNGLGAAVTFDRQGMLNRGTGAYTLESISQGKQIALSVSLAGFIQIQ